MEKKTLRKLLMRRCFWRVASMMCLIMAVQLLVIALWQTRKNPGRTEDFSNTNSVGQYAQLNVVRVSEAFARRGEESFYFLADSNDNIYIAVLSGRQYFDLCGLFNAGADSAAVTGMSTEAPAELQRVVCEYFADIAYSEYESYFGISYLDCTRTPSTAAFERLLTGAAVMGVLCVIFLIMWQLKRLRVAGSLSRLERKGKLAAALAQLTDAPPAQVEGGLTVTESFICDTRLGTLIARSEMQNPELHGYAFKRKRLRVRCGGRCMTIAWLTGKQRQRIRDMLNIPADALAAGSFVAPRYWDIPKP